MLLNLKVNLQNKITYQKALDHLAHKKKPLWTCPKCGAQFVTRNMWHSCGNWTVEKFLQDKGERAKLLYDSFVRLAQKCGRIKIAPTKTEIALMTRVRFAQVKRISNRGMTCAFWLKEKIQSPRFSRVDFIPPNNWIYTFRVTAPEQLDDEVGRWLCMAYKIGRNREESTTSSRRIFLNGLFVLEGFAVTFQGVFYYLLCECAIGQ